MVVDFRSGARIRHHPAHAAILGQRIEWKIAGPAHYAAFAALKIVQCFNSDSMTPCGIHSGARR
ncbi:MAG: hypothetical protein ACKO5K_00390, partial [Armatimonadota bacterium]